MSGRAGSSNLAGSSKARLDVLVEDDRAAIYGALLELVRQAECEQQDEIIALWRRKGKRAFEMEAAERNA
ncbi:conjugal transfer protein TraD [Sphingosinicella xenopeptidilytica]|uniref:Conjugal transfer protein TraD n=1 Tax=Sphingosinicella xenopeptidilytica TaxID=364098 RepID=A0ABW3BYJ4_SPHXN